MRSSKPPVERKMAVKYEFIVLITLCHKVFKISICARALKFPPTVVGGKRLFNFLLQSIKLRRAKELAKGDP